ncbi:translocation/assembly module TamB domain-containing protein [Aureibaculum sp. A20]|uniref:Translocation/assembly module TamB domain-containing protein n=1 Tax=Aureibaculum flavum TaxID=2795986 RepID=A0ABS0WR94_9FLAO|nr:translocation/assembly module TamB [Aureibaculum flavum]MBJ2174500.1 translocation/assembly module TamB domain-containing protein [Aureibaculum flavum]
MKDKNKSIKSRILRGVGKLCLGLVVLFILLILFIRSKWGQDIIVNKVVTYVSEKTHTKVEIDKLYITFGGNIMLNGLYLEDTKGDTLVYSNSLEANMPLWSIINGKGIGIDNLEWNGLKANIIRKDSLEGYNFQFLIDAFATENAEVENDTTSGPLKIIIESVDLNTVDIIFNDGVLGIESHFVLGNLSLAMANVDIEKMDFRTASINLKDATIKYTQYPVLPSMSNENNDLPFLAVDKLNLNNVVADYNSEVDHSRYHINIAQLRTEIPKIDLTNNTLEIVRFQLDDSKILINTTTANKITVKNDGPIVATTFEWPNFKINVGYLTMKNNTFSYVNNNAIPKNGVFNGDAIVLNNLTFQGKEIFLKDKEVGFNIENFNFNEASGNQLKTLQLNANVSDNSLSVNSFNLSLNDNRLQGNTKLNFNSLASFIKEPDDAQLTVNIPTFQFDIKDVYQFQPELRKNEIFQLLSKQYFNGNIEASGTLSSLTIPTIKVNWGKETELSLTGQLENVTDIDKLQFDILQFNAQTNKKSLSLFVNEDSLGISFPKLVVLKGNTKGSINDINTSIALNTTQGKANLKGHFNNENELAFDADLKIDNYELGNLLNDSKLGGLTASVTAKGNGRNINHLDGEILATIEHFGLNNYEIKDLIIDGKFKDGLGEIISNYKNDNLNLNLLADLRLDSISPQVSLDLDIIGADLQALGIMQRNVRTGLKLNANFKGNSDKFKLKASVEDGVVFYDDKSYVLGGVTINAFVDTDTTSATVKNKVLNFELHSNSNPQNFTTSIEQHLSSYFYRDTMVADSIKKPVNLVLNGKISQAPILNEVLLLNLKELDTIDVAVNFNEKARKLKAKITAPHINYAGNEIDSLAFNINTEMDKFVFDLGFKEINSGPLAIKKTSITGNQVNNELALSFTSFYDQKKLINIESTITGHRDSLRFHVLNDNLILNKNKWETPNSNEILINNNKLSFNDFKFSRNGEAVAITDVVSSSNKDRIDINFDNFKLNKIINYLNPENEIASGVLNGDFSVENPFEDLGIVTDLKIQQLKFLNVDLGTLSLDAKSGENNKYDFNVGLNGGEVDLTLKGDFLADNIAPQINLDVEINKFNIKAIEGFTEGEVSNTSGYFSGSFNLKGSLDKPEYLGKIAFNNANLKITQLNESFTLDNDELNIENKGLYVDNFTIQDENKNTFMLSGFIGTESFSNPTFDLKINAKNFQVINATKEDNDLVYGKAVFDADGTIKGNLEIPKIDLNLNVGSETDITYILPSAAVNIEEQDGVVIFVNRENPDAILTRTEEESVKITGFDVNANLKVDKSAKVKVIIDAETNDNFQVSGNGDLKLKMSPNGSVNLTGVYEIANGHYEMNLYNIVNRKFELTSDSRISWYGDPFDAKLDVKALYKIDASASPLMASQTTSSDASIKSQYQEVLPFYVYLNVDGELMQPEISFELDMPEEEQGAISGQVYARVQQVNKQENELNQQVFSLLVLSRFYPQSDSDGSSGGFASIARNNLNDALSDQLNVFSDKLLGDTGVELNFGLDSYTDYQGDSPEDRTQLEVAAKKKLFNDRLIVSVGSDIDIEGSSSSDESTPIIGNVSVEYLLTDNGRYRLKGFRKNEFENVIDGQTIISGIALIFTQEFNKFDELWYALLHGQTKVEKSDKNKKEKKQN